MMLHEIACEISNKGDLLIPAAIVEEMGLNAGDQIHIAYLSSDGISNDFREFLLTQEGAEQINEDQSSVQIPVQLLEQANIPAESDIQIMCLDGIIIIFRSTILNIQELNEVLNRLNKARQILDFYDFESDLSLLSGRLNSIINQLQEEGEEP